MREAGWYWLKEKCPLAGNGMDIGYFNGYMWMRLYGDDWEDHDEVDWRFIIGPKIEEPKDE